MLFYTLKDQLFTLNRVILTIFTSEIFNLKKIHNIQLSTCTITYILKWLLSTENPDLNAGFKDFCYIKYKLSLDLVQKTKISIYSLLGNNVII